MTGKIRRITITVLDDLSRLVELYRTGQIQIDRKLQPHVPIHR